MLKPQLPSLLLSVVKLHRAMLMGVRTAFTAQPSHLIDLCLFTVEAVAALGNKVVETLRTQDPTEGKVVRSESPPDVCTGNSMEEVP